MKCAVCGKGSSANEHYATLEERCNLDDKTFKALEKILDVRFCAPEEKDGAGNPIVCRVCTRTAIARAKASLGS